MSKRSNAGEFIPPGFYGEDEDNIGKKEEISHDSGILNKKIQSYLKIALLVVVGLIIVIVVYMMWKKSQEENVEEKEDNVPNTDHQNIVDNASDEELKDLLGDKDKVIAEKKPLDEQISNHKSLVEKYQIIDKLTPDILSRLNPSITSLLFLSKKTYESIVNNIDYKLSTTDKEILDYTSNFINQLLDVSPPLQPVEPVEPLIINPVNDLTNHSLDLPEASQVEVPQQEPDNISTETITISKKPAPKQKRGRKPGPKKNVRVEELDTDTDSVKDLKVIVDN